MASMRMMKWGGLASIFLLIGCGPAMDTGEEEAIGTSTSALSDTANRSLLITTTTVTRDAARTQDPCNAIAGNEDKVWTIGHLLKREAEKNQIAPSTYVSNWMNAWTGTVTINGQTVPPLVGNNVRTAWQRFAGGSTSLPLHKAPFYLLAIASRLDLRKHRPLGEPLGGEVRFIFGLLEAFANNPPCPTTASDAVSTVIFEYSPVKTNENDVRDFASRWLNLSTMTGSSYRTALQNLTEEVVNGGRLLRVRTNEGPIAGKVGGTQGGWDFGEFEPNGTTKFLQRSTIKQSPTMALAGGTSARMSDWIWLNRAGLLANASDIELASAGSAVMEAPIPSYSVPNRFPGSPLEWFRGGLNGASNNNEFWNGPYPTGLPSSELMPWIDARFRFSIGTCRGCHTGETGTRFLHILPNIPGTEAGRSAFLSGPTSVADPDPVWLGNIVRDFDEMQRRENDLRGLVNQAPVQTPVFGNYYQIRFRSSGKCLDSEGNTTADGAPSKIYTCHGNGNQRLALVPAPGQPSELNLYNVKYKHSGKCLDVRDASTTFGAIVEQRTCDSSRTSQQFSLATRPGSPNTRLLRFRHSGKYLVPQSSTADGTAVVQTGPPVSGFDLVE
jgi:hypothetical protein